PYGLVASVKADVVVLAEQNPPAQLKYSSLPPQQAGKDSLVVVTHGWDLFGTNMSWIDVTANAISNSLVARGVGNWQTVGYWWLANALTLFPDTAADNGGKEGGKLGLDIVNQNWAFVHLVGHSAGSRLIQSAAEVIKKLKPN